ncbi:MAG: ABC transporter ATP-binding protein [Dethiobacter sp.]|jgi:putative ABC transport system ATP-binding protein|nr:ABC transporter ATP-binding protein [Dethiobacter sp.]
MLELRDAQKTIHLPSGAALELLQNISLKISPGESVAVLGRSGTGKSTLLGLLGLLDNLDQGSYLVDGYETTTMGDRSLACLRGEMFGFVYQRFCLMSRLSAFQNVEAPLLYRPGRKVERRRAVCAALEKVGLSERAKHKPDQLSGGEQQRVAIARALIHCPRVILADEPTGSLDHDTGGMILDLLLNLVKDTGAALVVVTHETQIAKRLARVLRISDGLLIEEKL